MKKNFKPFLIIAVGAFLIGAGYMLGGRINYFIRKPAPNSRFERVCKNILGKYSYGNIFADEEEDMDDYEYGGYFEGKTESLNGVTDVSIYLKTAVIEVDFESNFDYAEYKLVDMEKKYFSIKIIDGKIEIEDMTPRNKNLWFNFGMKKNSPKIFLHLPKKFECKNFVFNAGVSMSKLYGIAADNFVLNSGVGEIKIKNMYAKKSCIFNTGVGEAEIEESEINNLTLKTGVGEVSFSGKLSGNTVIEGGIGEINFSINGSEDDYDFDLSAGFGEVRVNGQGGSSFLGSHRSKTSSAVNHISVTGGIGGIYLKFKN